MTYKTSLSFFILAVLLLCEASRFFQIGGIAPNLFLIFFAVLLTATAFGDSMRIPVFLTLLGFFVAGGAILFGFWFLQVCILSCVVVLMYVVRRKLIGTPFLDFIIFLAGGTVLFYGVLSLTAATPFLIGVTLQEAAYTILLGIIAWLVVRYLHTYGRS